LTRIAIVAGSIVAGWSKALRLLVEDAANYGKVFVLTEEAFARTTADSLKNILDKQTVFMRVLGFDKNIEERLLSLYVNTNPDVLIYLYRPNVVDGTAYDVGCTCVPRGLHGLEGLIPLAKASAVPVIGFVRHCANIGSSLLGLQCECMDKPQYVVDKAYYVPDIDTLRKLLRSDEAWLW